MRPSWYVINCWIVWIISCLSTCVRLHVGGLLWNPITKRILAVGYNGAPRGRPHCEDEGIGCEMESGHCVRCLHCEDNIFMWVPIEEAFGCVLFLTHMPCRRCCNKIIQAQISEVVYTASYHTDQETILRNAGIKMTHMPKSALMKDLLTRVLEWCKV